MTAKDEQRKKLDEYVAISKEYFKRAIAASQKGDKETAVTGYGKGLSILAEAHDVATGYIVKGGGWAREYQEAIKKMTDTIVEQVDIINSKDNGVAAEQKKSGGSSGFLGSLFGGSKTTPAAPPIPSIIPEAKTVRRSAPNANPPSAPNPPNPQPAAAVHKEKPNVGRGSFSGPVQTPAQPVLARSKSGSAAKLLSKHDQKHIEAILKDVVDPKDLHVRWEDVTGCEASKQHLKEAVVLPMLRPDLFEGLRTPPKGVLLFGPPGNGKTMLAKAVATECNATFFNISASSITSKFVGESEKQVRSLFSAARKLQPSVIFIDEIDSMLTSRKSSEHDASRRLKTEFLVQMDGAGSNADDRILILGATNRPFELDDAALRRMPKRVYIPLPDKETRKGLIASKLKGEKATLDISALLQITEGYSGSDLASLCSEAAMYPLRDIPQSKMATADPSTVRAITLEDFKAASKVIRPSVKPETMRQCIEWGKAFGVN
eukprot:TRINITY_DN1271_c0_g1_i1.p1 TRINITY_DN1271_c0_g1~~TRINITY_DN1271_c0_g1_i1.p1  ORF type:complete len:524 (+),score=130.06 TRINITY_DN1271_c0_g1_i1:103-1572(+)